MSLKVTPIDPGKDKRWDDFVINHPESTIYHHSSWAEVIRTVYGHELIYLALENDKKEVQGIAPFILIKSCLTGKRVVSLPFATYCNPILPATEVDKVLRFLLEHYSDVDYIELKVVEKDDIRIPAGFSKSSNHITHILNLDHSLEELLMSFHSTSVRQRIRKGEKNNLSLRIGETEEDLKQFYRLHTMVRKKLGLPPQPFSFFIQMWQHLRPFNQVLIPLVEHGGRVVSAAFILKFKDTFYLEQSATDPCYLRHCANQTLIWESIKLAHADGARYLDFGRSALGNKSLIEFKERWSAKGFTLSTYYYPKRPPLNTEESMARQILNRVNRHLPNSLLKLEGRLLYPHLG